MHGMPAFSRIVFPLHGLTARFVFPFLFAPFLLRAQITITSADMPQAGDTLRYSVAQSASPEVYNLSGPGQTWDFSGLTPTSQDLASYKSSLQTPYAFFFLGLNRYGRKLADTLGVAAFQFTEIYNFFRKTTQAFEVEGIGLRYQGLPLPAYYTVRDKLFQFPLQYGDRDSSDFKFSISISTLASYSQVGYRINETDGWGSITTPFGTFNCLRVKSTVVSDDSLNISGFPIKFPRRQIEYKWLANGNRIPILEITGNQIGNNFVVSQVRYRDIPRSVTPPWAPSAAFSASPLQTEPFNPVALTNTSTGSFLSFQWTFVPSEGVYFEEGTDTSRNPVVAFSLPGLYTVRLRASNFSGFDTEEKTGYIEVLDPTATGLNRPRMAQLRLGGRVYAFPLSGKGQAAVRLCDLPGRSIPLQQQGDAWIAPRMRPGFYLVTVSGEGPAIQTKLIQHSPD